MWMGPWLQANKHMRTLQGEEKNSSGHMQCHGFHKLLSLSKSPPSVFGSESTSTRKDLPSHFIPSDPTAHGSQWLHTALWPAAFRYIAYGPP
ncbi:hypothetical protein B0T13DRAFT_281936 [Neurospora crassa]|nr:hypothetical protein B0T13DRAFT_281936 [Neurospora crassa]